MAVTSRTRKEIWEGLYDAKRMVRYYNSIHARYQMKNQGSMWLLVILGTSAVAVLSDKIPDVMQPIWGLAVAGAALWVLFAEYAAKSAVALSIAHQCEALVDDWKDLFAKVELEAETTMEDGEARDSLRVLKKRMSDTTYASGHAKLTDNAKINKTASTDAADELRGSYAH